MRTVFADTSYWIAPLNPRDRLHERVRQVARSLGVVRVVTSEVVLAECLNDFSRRGTFMRRLAVGLVERLRADENTTIVPQTSAQFREALALYSTRPDKTWSHTNCASIGVMQSVVALLATQVLFLQHIRSGRGLRRPVTSRLASGAARYRWLGAEKFEDFFRLLSHRPDSERSWTVPRQAIDDKGFDLKAVNPHAPNHEDTRTPEELLVLIDEKGREVAEALAVLRSGGSHD